MYSKIINVSILVSMLVFTHTHIISAESATSTPENLVETTSSAESSPISPSETSTPSSSESQNNAPSADVVLPTQSETEITSSSTSIQSPSETSTSSLSESQNTMPSADTSSLPEQDTASSVSNPSPDVVNLPSDITPPRSIRNLQLQHVGMKSADITWTTPSDNDVVAGYDIRISLHPIQISNWSTAIQLPIGITPHEAGEVELATLGDLPQNASIYAAVRSYDRAGNISDISNVIRVTTHGSAQNNIPAGVGGEAQIPLSPTNDAVVRMLLQISGVTNTVPEDLIFVNFINLNTGVSVGGAAVNGVVALSIPSGKYAVKLILPPYLVAGDVLPTFEVDEGADVDLGIVRLIATSDSFSESVDQPKGIGGALGYIVELLLEILKQLKEISGKLGS